MDIKQSTAIKLPIFFASVIDGSPLSGVTYDKVTVFIQGAGGASVQKVVAPGDWTEVDAVNMPGEYDLQFYVGELGTLGPFRYTVSYGGIAFPYRGLVTIVQVLGADIYSRIGAPVGASISADLQNAITAIETAIKGSGNKDLTQVDTDVQTAITNIATLTAIAQRILALSYDNVVEDGQSYDGNAKLLGSDVWFYDTAAHATLNDHVTGLLYRYRITGTYDTGGNCTMFRMTRVL